MARFTVLVLFLTLALAPLANAEPSRMEDSSGTEWTQTLTSAIDWLLGWIPTWDQPKPDKAGAYIVPNGVAATDSGGTIIVNGGEVTTADAGAMLVPNG